MVRDILLSFIPLFVAVDPLGLLPVFLSLTKDLDARGRRDVVRQSITTALLISIGFLLVGQFLFGVLQVETGDFLIAGGAILFILAMRDIIQEEKAHRHGSDTVGAVPLGTPLIAGPAVLTTSLILVESYGWAPTIISVLLNLGLAALVFSLSGPIIGILGRTGVRVVSKITALFLAAIGVLMVRLGITEILSGFTP